MLLSLLAPTLVVALYLFVFGLESLFFALACLLASLTVGGVLLRYWFNAKAPPVAKGTVGFFHPNAGGGGGGERVLWCAAAAIQEAYPTRQIVIYTGDGLSSEDLLASARRTFSMPLPKRIQVVHLRRAALLEPSQYPRWTLARQAMGSMRVAVDALRLLRPEVFLDTAGWAFAYPLARAAGCRVVSYTHYPTVSADMLVQVRSGAARYNNRQEVAQNGLLTAVKLVYYYCFATAYGAAGGCANAVMANSSWTADHVSQLFWAWRLPAVVHPPCDTAQLAQLPLQRKLKRLYFVSLAQFRPEKDHSLQLRAFARARKIARAYSGKSMTSAAVLSARLKLIGGCRNAEDEARVAGLRREAASLDIADFVDFHVNAPWDEVKLLLGEAVGGLHTMVDEHFGIGIVQYMAAGVVPIVNNSAGPRMDILDSKDCTEGFYAPRSCGYLCSTEKEYSDAITEVAALEDSLRTCLAAAARASSARFSDHAFKAAFLDALRPALPRSF